MVDPELKKMVKDLGAALNESLRDSKPIVDPELRKTMKELGDMISYTLRISTQSTKPMEPKLKELMKELGNAINESLSDSEQISRVVSRIKEGGFDIFLVLEATIGVSKEGDKSVEKVSVGL